MIEIFKKIISLITEFFRYKKSNNDFEFFKYKRNKEAMKQRVKLRKHLRDIAKKGQIEDFFKIIIIVSCFFVTGCQSIIIHPRYEFEKRYESLLELKESINEYNIDDSFWILSSQTFEDIINEIENKYSNCN